MTTLTAVTSPLSTMACACSIHVASSTALYRPCPVPQWDPGNHCHVLYPRGGAGRGSSAADAAPAAAAAAGVARVATAVNTSQLRTVYCICAIQLPKTPARAGVRPSDPARRTNAGASVARSRLRFRPGPDNAIPRSGEYRHAIIPDRCTPTRHERPSRAGKSRADCSPRRAPSAAAARDFSDFALRFCIGILYQF